MSECQLANVYLTSYNERFHKQTFFQDDIDLANFINLGETDQNIIIHKGTHIGIFQMRAYNIIILTFI